MINLSTKGMNLDNLKGKYNNAVRGLPVRFGAAAIEHVKDNFRSGGFMDESLDKWPARKNDKDPGRGLLIGKGTAHLSRDVRVLETNNLSVKVGTTLPYASVHNEGFKGDVKQNVGSFTRQGKTVRAFSRLIHQNIPQRKFLGASRSLFNKCKAILIEELKKLHS
jgi:phage gpG-like protein